MSSISLGKMIDGHGPACLAAAVQVLGLDHPDSTNTDGIGLINTVHIKV